MIVKLAVAIWLDHSCRRRVQLHLCILSECDPVIRSIRLDNDAARSFQNCRLEETGNFSGVRRRAGEAELEVYASLRDLGAETSAAWLR